MNPDILQVDRLPLRLHKDERRVIARLFGVYGETRLPELVARIGALPDARASEFLEHIFACFQERHHNLRDIFEENFAQAAKMSGWSGEIDEQRKLLVGAYFTMEYSIEAAALFNPSIVPHPDQANLPGDCLRFIMSLRATGEGHVSSVVFRTGTLCADDHVTLDPPARFHSSARRAPDQKFLKPLFMRKLGEMSVNISIAGKLLEPLPEQFTFVELSQVIERFQDSPYKPTNYSETLDAMMWLAASNYQIQMGPDASVSDIVLFPGSENESRGIEDLRLVRFVEDDGSVMHYGTYTAYNGHRILPMILETEDFNHISVHTLNGACARDKGMALFPRRINGHYVMCSRIDGRNLYIMYSDYIHFWESAELLSTPQHPWELNLIGNCGSPIETQEGWLLLTHGVGPMRRYCISAMLLDLDDPARILGKLPLPLLAPGEDEREGYVPNVLYSCGSLVHNGRLYIPYAMADQATGMAAVHLEALLETLKHSPVSAT